MHMYYTILYLGAGIPVTFEEFKDKDIQHARFYSYFSLGDANYPTWSNFLTLTVLVGRYIVGAGKPRCF